MVTTNLPSEVSVASPLQHIAKWQAKPTTLSTIKHKANSYKHTRGNRICKLYYYALQPVYYELYSYELKKTNLPSEGPEASPLPALLSGKPKLTTHYVCLSSCRHEHASTQAKTIVEAALGNPVDAHDD